VLPINQDQDYEIEAKLKVSKGSGGLVIGMNDRYDHFRVEIDDKSKILFIKDTPSRQKIEKLYKGSFRNEVDPDDFFTITYRKAGDISYLFINEILVKQFLNLVLEGDKAGFSVGISSEIVVDYLKIRYLKPHDSPLHTEVIRL